MRKARRMSDDPAVPLVLPLPADAGILTASSLATSISDALAQGRPVKIDSSAAETVDLSTLQILVAAHRQAARDRIPLDVTVPPGGKLAAALETYGFLASADARLVLVDGSWTGVDVLTESAQ